MGTGDSPSFTAPTPQDTAIVMYTSGSTGTPKVLILHYRLIIVIADITKGLVGILFNKI